jgi:hypothetical protein
MMNRSLDRSLFDYLNKIRIGALIYFRYCLFFFKKNICETGFAPISNDINDKKMDVAEKSDISTIPN